MFSVSIEWARRVISRQSTLAMYFSIWDFSGEGFTPIFIIALKNSFIFPFSNGRHSSEVLKIISLMHSPIILVVWCRAISDAWCWALRMICSMPNVWVGLGGVKGRVVRYEDCCSTIKPTMVKSLNSLYVVFPIVVFQPRVRLEHHWRC